MKKNVIVSLADANYFPLLNELIDSIKFFKESENTAICILDAGLTENQKEILSKKVDEINQQNGILKFLHLRLRVKNGLKVRYLELFCQIIFQIMKNICGLIAMHGSMIGMQLIYISKLVKMEKLGITQTMGPGYRVMSKVNWIFGKIASIKSQNF